MDSIWSARPFVGLDIEVGEVCLDSEFVARSLFGMSLDNTALILATVIPSFCV